jgi:hypothetical protein
MSGELIAWNFRSADRNTAGSLANQFRVPRPMQMDDGHLDHAL